MLHGTVSFAPVQGPTSMVQNERIVNQSVIEGKKNFGGKPSISDSNRPTDATLRTNVDSNARPSEGTTSYMFTSGGEDPLRPSSIFS